MKLLKVKNLAHLSTAIWLGSLATFFGFVFLVLPKNGIATSSQSIFLICIILTGVIAFLAAFILYSTHILFLRNKPVVGHSRRSRVLFFLPLMGLLVAVSLFGGYRLGAANNYVNDETSVVTEPTVIPVETVTNRNENPIYTAPTSAPTIHETQSNDQSNLVRCNVYGQTFNLTPEKCKFYQSEEAGANKAIENNDGYVPPYRNYETNSTPVPTSAPEKYHSSQEDCRRACYSTYQNYPDTSLAKQQCVNSCQ
jgi:hypothetical protein